MRGSFSRVGALGVGIAGVIACGGGGATGTETGDAGASFDASMVTMSDASDAAPLADAVSETFAEAGLAEAGLDAPSEASAGDAALETGDGGIGASPLIVVDQFGYRPSDEKIAVIRSPQAGFDAPSSFTPGPMVALVDAHSSQKLLEAAPAAWNAGASDPSSGDKAWWFDFPTVTTPGEYFVLDTASGARSDLFRIADGVYADVLKHSLRMFYYQRDGIAKDAQYAGAAWADTMEHPQDATCGLYTNGSTPKDLHGGWFDAADENKYSTWTAGNAIELLRAYSENPKAFPDDAGIPESGNGVPDILDEVKWGIDWIARMQNADGSVLSIVSHAGGNPPSADTAACQYGPASTSGTLSSAAAFAYASIVFKSVPAASTVYPGYADRLATMAQSAWNWAAAHPSVTFFNKMNGLGAREQEVDAAGLVALEVQAAVFLYELTGTPSFRDVVDANYMQLQTALDPFNMQPADTLLEYANAPGAPTPAVVQSIQSTFKSAVEGPDFFGASQSNRDPYLAYLQTYPWGSSKAKAGQGNMFYYVVAFKVDAAISAASSRYAERYVHYLHGVNPLQLVYLSNMGAYGADRSVTSLFTNWFWHGSNYGAPPGFLVAGPNPGYTWDVCCPSNCGSPDNNALCGSGPLSPPAGQPDQKSYKDFNDLWPLESWLVSEPNDAYQAEYVRLLSKFVP